MDLKAQSGARKEKVSLTYKWEQMETTLEVTTNSLPSTAPDQVKQKHEG